MAEREYRRLTRARARRGTSSSKFANPLAARASLWLGRDHLLSIDSNLISESYKRFYFRDIQAITICQNGRRRIWNAILGILLVFYAAICYGNWSPTYSFGPILFQVVVGLFLIVPLVANNLRGPTCDCTLRTAVQTEDLPSLGRLWTAQRILGRIRPLIATAQGELSRDGIAAGVENWNKPAAPPPSRIPPPMIPEEQPLETPEVPLS